jgi:DNA-binding FadR family transcriptional regulator
MSNDSPTAIRVPKAAQLVANTLRRRIVSGELDDGAPLPNESALMKVFEVSRPTLREALRILENEGLVTVKRGAHGGARVHQPDVRVASRYAAQLLQIRGTTMEDLFAIEPAAVRMLAERPPKAAIRSLRAHLLREAAALDEPLEYAREATAFHALIVQLCGNATLSLFSEMLTEIVERHHRATFEGAASLRREYADVGNEHHRHLVDLIEQGRSEEAEAFWRFHIDGAVTRALRHLGPKTIVELLD